MSPMQGWIGTLSETAAARVCRYAVGRQTDKLHQPCGPLGQCRPLAWLNGGRQAIQLSGSKCIEPIAPREQSGRSKRAVVGQRKAGRGQVKLRQCRQRRPQAGLAGRGVIIGHAGHPGLDLPQRALVLDKTGVVVSFQRQGTEIESFDVDMPEHGLNEFETLDRRILGGPAPQA